MSDITFAGEKFVVAERVGLMPLLRFAHLARAGVDADDMEGLAAMYDLLEQCIDEGDWVRFQNAATRSRAQGEELQAVIADAISVISERPTGQPSDSSDGLRVIEPMSESEPVSSGRHPDLQLVRELEQEGHPDKAEFVMMQIRASGT